MNEKLFLVTVRNDCGIILRMFTRIDLTYMDEDDVLEMMEHELRSDYRLTYSMLQVDILPVTYEIFVIGDVSC